MKKVSILIFIFLQVYVPMQWSFFIKKPCEYNDNSAVKFCIEHDHDASTRRHLSQTSPLRASETNGGFSESIEISESTLQSESQPHLITKEFIESMKIKCILSDVDGTLISKKRPVSDNTCKAIKSIISAGYPFFLCTGRSRISMSRGAGQEFVDIFDSSVDRIPGVYQQGLTVYGKGGELIYRKALDHQIIQEIVDYCNEKKLSLLGYSDEEIYCHKRNQCTDKVIDWSDPMPQEVPDGLTSLQSKGILIQKLIIVDNDDVLESLRPSLEEKFGGKVSLTKAVPGLLELLPFGSCKGEGVKVLLEHFKISPEEVLAFGDGENDIEMLTYVKYGVAMENANRLLKDKVKYLTSGVDNDGVARVLQHIPRQQ